MMLNFPLDTFIICLLCVFVLGIFVHVHVSESGRVREREDSVSWELIQAGAAPTQHSWILEAQHSFAFALGFSVTCHYRERMPLLHPLSTKA